MRQGKVTDAILKRSVINLIDYKNHSVVSGAGIGKDCAVIDAGEVYVMTSTETAAENTQSGSAFAVIKAANNIAASGGVPISASAAFLLKKDFDEKRLKNLTRKVLSGCRQAGIQLSGGHTEISEFVTEDVVTITVTGFCQKNRFCTLSAVKPGMDLVVSKWIGIEGTALLLEGHREELLQKLPESYVALAEDFDKWLCIMEEAAVASKHGVAAMHDIADGGIFAALWDFAEGAKTGFVVDMKAIPVRQETIEFCEIFDVNPYQMKSAGSLLIAVPHGEALVYALKEAGIPAAVIGHTTDDNDKKLINGDEVRYLDKP